MPSKDKSDLYMIHFQEVNHAGISRKPIDFVWPMEVIPRLGDIVEIPKMDGPNSSCSPIGTALRAKVTHVHLRIPLRFQYNDDRFELRPTLVEFVVLSLE